MIPQISPYSYSTKLEELKDQIKQMQGLVAPRAVAEAEEVDPDVGTGAIVGADAGEQAGSAAEGTSGDIAGAGIMAGAATFGSLMKNAADRKALERKLMFQAINAEHENKAKAAQALGEGQRAAFSRLMQNFRGVIR